MNEVKSDSESKIEELSESHAAKLGKGLARKRQDGIFTRERQKKL
jgi:hypothetical protein